MTASVEVRWGVLDITFAAPDRQVARWLADHFHTSPDVHQGDVPSHEEVEDAHVTAVVDGPLVERTVANVRSAELHQVEGHVGEFWLVGESDGRPAWCHGLVSDDRVAPADRASGQHVIIAT